MSHAKAGNLERPKVKTPKKSFRITRNRSIGAELGMRKGRADSGSQRGGEGGTGAVSGKPPISGKVGTSVSSGRTSKSTTQIRKGVGVTQGLG